MICYIATAEKIVPKRIIEQVPLYFPDLVMVSGTPATCSDFCFYNSIFTAGNGDASIWAEAYTGICMAWDYRI